MPETGVHRGKTGLGAWQALQGPLRLYQLIIKVIYRCRDVVRIGLPGDNRSTGS
jgi:hypothetical protein